MNWFKIVCCCASLVCLFELPAAADNPGDEYKVKTIVIDAGHGGKDPGSFGYRKTKEKDIALSVALKVGTYLESHYPDVEVIYTRKTDVFLALHERAKVANDADADLFISIHANCHDNHTASGSETYVLGLHRTEANLAVAKKENSVIELEDNREDHYEFDVNSPEGHIIMTMKQNAHLEQSIALASKIQWEFEHRVKRKNRGVKQAGFYVLYKTTMPSNLVELGFISNPEEELFLRSAQGQDYMASAIFRAIRDYKTETDKQTELVARQEVKNAPIEDEIKPDVAFKIQFHASKKPEKKTSKLYQDFDQVETEETANGYIRYLTGNFVNYEEVKARLEQVFAQGYTDAYIVAYRSGERISVREALSKK